MDKGLDESNFGGESNAAISAVKAFDAFPKVKPSYTQKTGSGSAWTVFLICASVLLMWSELKRWWVGDTTHTFSVEQGVGRDLQINLDLVIAMKCEDLHVNLQDASGDRILAGMALNKDGTLWNQWVTSNKGRLAASKQERLDLSGYPGFGEYREEDVHNYMGAAKSSKKFSKTPRLPRHTEADSCRIFGTMHTNKVQGDFHITARGHGYMEFGAHLDHRCKSFVTTSSLSTNSMRQPSTSHIMSTSSPLARSIPPSPTHSTTQSPPPPTTSTNTNTTSLSCPRSTRLIQGACDTLTNTPNHLPLAQTVWINIRTCTADTMSSRINTL